MLHDKPSANNHLACLLKSIIFAEGDSESGLLAQRRVGGARRRGGELDCSASGRGFGWVLVLLSCKCVYDPV